MAMNNMAAMMKQARKMQAEMAKAQEEVSAMTFTASAGGGMVKVTVNGDMTITDLVIDPAAVDPEDTEMLQDMVAAAVNEALRGITQMTNDRMSSVTAGMPNIPGMPMF